MNSTNISSGNSGKPNPNVLDAFGDTISMIVEWARWCRKYPKDMGIGYPKQTVEGRLASGELVGISGSGKYIPAGSPDAERVEGAVTALSLKAPEKAELLRLRYVKRMSHRDISFAMSVSVRTVQRMEDSAVAWLDAKLS